MNKVKVIGFNSSPSSSWAAISIEGPDGVKGLMGFGEITGKAEKPEKNENAGGTGERQGPP